MEPVDFTPRVCTTCHHTHVRTHGVPQGCPICSIPHEFDGPMDVPLAAAVVMRRQEPDAVAVLSNAVDNYIRCLDLLKAIVDNRDSIPEWVVVNAENVLKSAGTNL